MVTTAANRESPSETRLEERESRMKLRRSTSEGKMSKSEKERRNEERAAKTRSVQFDTGRNGQGGPDGE